MKKSNFMRVAALFTAVIVGTSVLAEDVSLLNVSFDVSRELYRDFNGAFARYYKQKTGKTLNVKQSHGGSSKQARAVTDGLEADVVTLNQATDLDLLADKKFIRADWRNGFGNNSSPFVSTVVFLVRKGNPKGIKDWNDLVKPGVQVIIPNPKTSGNGRYSYLAAFAYAAGAKKDVKAGEDFVRKLFANAPLLPTGGRDATTAFTQRGQGDALLTFEAEVLQIKKNAGGDQFEIVLPSQSVKADFPVAVVEPYAAKRGTTELANQYLEYLYSAEGQELGVKHFYRPVRAGTTKRHQSTFGKIRLVTVEEVFGDWKSATKKHFADGGLFDRIYRK